MTKNHGNQIKDDKRYEELRGHGMSKEKAARIANSDPHKTAKKGGKASQYEDLSKDELYQKAKEIGIEGRSSMSKDQLINALRHH